MSRINPRSSEEAFGYQFQDCANLLAALGPFTTHAEGRESFVRQLGMLEAYIAAYKSGAAREEAYRMRDSKGARR